MRMQTVDVIILIVGLLTVIFPFVLFLRNKKSSVNKALLFLAFTAGPLWTVAIFLFNQSISPQLDLFSLNLIYLVSIFTAFFTYWLTNSYPFKAKIKLGEFILVFIVGGYFIYELFFTDNFIQKILYIGNDRVPLLGNMYILWFIWFASLFIWRIVQMRENMKSLSGIEKKQMQYIVSGFTIVGLGVVPTNMILPFFGIFEYIWLGPIFIALMITLITYGISTTRFLNVQDIKNKVWMIIKSVLLPVCIGGLLSYLLIKTEIFNTFFAYTLLAFIPVIITFLIVRNFYENSTDLPEFFLSKTSAILNLEEIGSQLDDIIKKNLKSTKFNYTIYSNSDEIHFNFDKNNSLEMILLDQFWDYFKDYNKLIILAELEYLRVLSIEENNIWKYKRFITLIEKMRNKKIQIVMPISLENNKVALVFLGNHSKNTIYSNNEVKALINLRSSIKVTLDRCLLHQETEIFNTLLKQKVSEQTKELQQKVQELEEARRKEADMIDIMGHELRTPMSVVKLNTDLLQNFSRNITRRKEDFNKYVKRIKNAVETEIDLINTLLSSAKLEGDKIDLNPTQVNVVEQIQMAMHAQEERAERKNLDLNTNFSPTAQYVYADHARTIEILNNLIDNAVKYTEEGSVTITTENEGGYVRISVIDTGIGMTKDDLSRLGSKFFRTSNYIRSEQSDDFDIVRPGGSGLGLYVTFNLIKRMGGDIHVESELNKGSTFTFTLPKYIGQKTKDGSDSKDMFERLGLKKKKDSIREIQQ